MVHYISLLLMAITCVSLYAKPTAQEHVLYSWDNSACTKPYSLEVSLRTLVLQPHSSDLDYAVQAIPIPLPSPQWITAGINPSFNVGFDLGLSGIMHTNETLLFVHWQHFASSSSSSRQVSGDNMIGPFFEIGPDATPYKKASGTVKFSFNTFDVNWGKCFSTNECFQATVYAGISFARIKQKLLSTFADLEDSVTRAITTPSIFTGAGPQIGFDFSYNLIDDFHFVGKGSSSILFGVAKNNTSYQSTSPFLAPLGISPVNAQSTTVAKRNTIVLGLEERLGFAYMVQFCETFFLTLEAGFDAKIYLQALQSINIGSEVITPPVSPDTVGVFARTFQKTLSNFSLAGPYIAIAATF
jgi:hypothetical protein